MMDLTAGMVVRSKAGRDKDRFFVVLKVQGDKAFVADGKKRELLNPKAKNEKHLQKTNTVIELNEIDTDKKLRHVLHGFNYPNSPKA